MRAHRFACNRVGARGSRAGSCGEQHGAQVSAQLPAHPDTTSHAFSVKLALPCYTLHLRSRPHAPSWNRLRCFCVLDCQCVVCVWQAPRHRRVVTHAHRIEVASTAGAALPWALKDAERARAVRAAGAAIAVWEVRSRTGVVQRRVLYGAARCRQRTGDTTKGKVSGTALSLAIWPACAHEQGGFRSGLRVAQLSQCGRFSLARRWCNVCCTVLRGAMRSSERRRRRTKLVITGAALASVTHWVERARARREGVGGDLAAGCT